MYTIRFSGGALRDLERVDKKTAERIMSKIHWIANNTDATDLKNLRGELAGFCKLRVGNFRVIFELISEKQTLNVHSIGHRSRVYKGRG